MYIKFYMYTVVCRRFQWFCRAHKYTARILCVRACVFLCICECECEARKEKSHDEFNIEMASLFVSKPWVHSHLNAHSLHIHFVSVKQQTRSIYMNVCHVSAKCEHKQKPAKATTLEPTRCALLLVTLFHFSSPSFAWIHRHPNSFVYKTPEFLLRFEFRFRIRNMNIFFSFLSNLS